LIHLDEENTKQIHFLNLIDQNETFCLLLNYLRYVLRFISAQVIVAFSAQRLYLICLPFSNKFKSTSSAWLTVSVIVCVSFIVNTWVPFIYEKIAQENNLFACDIRKEFSQEYFHITLTYICITMLIPICIIFVSNSFIISHIVKSKENAKIKLFRHRKQKNIKKKSTNIVQLQKPETKGIKKATKFKPYFVSMNQMVFRITNKANNNRHITKVLITITFAYAILNLPYFIAWSLYYLIIILFENHDPIKQNQLYSAVELAKIFYVLNYSIYFYIFISSGSVFRNQLKYSSNSFCIL